MEKTASAVWEGGIKDGKGSISTQSGVLRDAPYGFRSRFEISEVHLTVKARVPGTDAATFEGIAGKAKEGCPVSKVLKGADITMGATLES